MTIRARPNGLLKDLKYEVRIPVFYNVDKVDWFLIDDSNVKISDTEHWLHLEYGLIYRNWNWEWKAESPGSSRASVVVFKFENETDAMAFKLRWM